MKQIAIFILALTMMTACGEQKPQLPENKRPKDFTKENLLEMNIALAQKETEDIQHFLDSLGGAMTKSEFGFWYEVKSVGEGAPIVRGEKVRVEYNLRLLDGTLCYTPENGGTKNVTVGCADETKGLDEALLMMREGGQMNVLVPANFAYGMVGDQKKLVLKKQYSTKYYR